MYGLKLGLRSLLYRKKQYTALFLVCMVGVGISLFCLFLVEGMLSSLEDKAKLYYGGDFTFIGGQNELTFSNVDNFIEKLELVFPDGLLVLTLMQTTVPFILRERRLGNELSRELISLKKWNCFKALIIWKEIP